MLKSRSNSFSRSTGASLLSSLSESEGGSPHSRRSKTTGLASSHETSERRRLTKKASLSKRISPLPPSIENKDLTESFTNQLIGLISSSFAGKWKDMSEEERATFKKEILSATTTFELELLLRLQPQPRFALQTTTVHFINNDSRSLCFSFSEMGLQFVGAVNQLLTEVTPDPTHVVDAAMKITSKMNELQTFSFPSSLYTQYIIYPQQILEYNVKPNFITSDNLSYTDNILRTSVVERLRYFYPKLIWSLSILSSNCIEEESTKEIMWLVASLHSLREEIIVITKLCKTLEAIKKKPSLGALPVVSSEIFQKLSDSFSTLGKSSTTPTYDCIVKLVKNYVRDALEREISFQHAVLLILESRPADMVWNILSSLYMKEKLKSESQKLSIPQMRVLDLLTKWLKMDGVVLGPNLLRKVNYFFEEHDIPKPDLDLKTTPQITTKLAFVSPTIPLYKLGSGITMANLIYEFSPSDVATQMTIVARNFYLRIKPVSLASLWWSKDGCTALAEPVSSFIQHINSLNDWAATLILSSENKKIAVRYLIKLAAKLYDLENFSSLGGLFSVFSMNSLAPLIQKCLNSMSKRTLETYKFLESELSPTGNFHGIRKALEKSTKETAIPFLATVLSDMTMMNEFHDLEPDFTLNVPKYQAISNVLGNFFKFTNSNPVLTEIPSLLSLIEALPCLPQSLLSKDYGGDTS